jgi:flagellar motor switch protein FliM
LTDVYRIATRLLAVEREVKDDLEALAKIHKDFGDLLMMLGDELARLADYVETLSGEEDDAGV